MAISTKNSDETKQKLFRFITNSKKKSYSLILSGSKGTGKSDLVKQLIQEILNTNEISIHPNILWINTNKSTNVAVSEIRKISNFMYKTTYHSDLPKLIVIDYVDNLNIYSFNALLKILEEPTQNTHFILIANDVQILPKTIQSRSILLKCPFPNPATVYQQIKQQFPDLSAVQLNEYLSIASTTEIISKLITTNALEIYKELLELLQKTEKASAKLYKFIEKNFSTLEQLEIFHSLMKNLIHKIIKAKLSNISSTIAIENKIIEKITTNNIQILFAIDQEMDSFINGTKTFGLDIKTVVLVVLNKLNHQTSLRRIF